MATIFDAPKEKDDEVDYDVDGQTFTADEGFSLVIQGGDKRDPMTISIIKREGAYTDDALTYSIDKGVSVFMYPDDRRKLRDQLSKTLLEDET